MNMLKYLEKFAAQYYLHFKNLKILVLGFTLLTLLVFGWFYYSVQPFTIGRTRENIARALVKKTGMLVKPQNIILADPLSSQSEFFPKQHTVFFLASQDKKSKNDVYSAQCFLSSTGIPFAFSNIINLSQTPHCNEKQMANWKNRLAFVSKKDEDSMEPAVVTIVILNKIKPHNLLPPTKTIESDQIFVAGTKLFYPFLYKITPASDQKKLLLKWEKGNLKFIQITKNNKIKKYKFDPVKGKLISRHALNSFTAKSHFSR